MKLDLKIQMSHRLIREIKTITIMVKLYCHKNHKNKNHLCPSCQEILDYAKYRIQKCPFQECKPACKACTIHCYNSPERKQMKEIMAFSGPRMLWRHPVLSLRHLLDEHRPPVLTKKPRQN